MSISFEEAKTLSKKNGYFTDLINFYELRDVIPESVEIYDEEFFRKVIIPDKLPPIDISDTEYVNYMFRNLSYYQNEQLLNQLYKLIIDSILEENVQFLEKYIDYISKELCKSIKVPLSFWMNHRDKIDWHYLCQNPSIPVSFFEENLENLNWAGISLNEDIPLWFFEKYKDKLDWYYLCLNQKIPLFFFKENMKLIRWVTLSSNENVPFSFLFENYSKIPYIRYLYQRKDVDLVLIKSKIYDTRDDYIYNMIWENLCKNKHIPSWFFEENIDRVKWKELCSNEGLNSSFFEKYIDKLDWGELSHNKNIDVEFLTKYKEKLISFGSLCLRADESFVPLLEENLDKIDWDYICTSDLPESFFEKYQDRINWDYIWYGKFPLSFFEKFKDRIGPKTLTMCQLPFMFYVNNNLPKDKIRDSDLTLYNTNKFKDIPWKLRIMDILVYDINPEHGKD